MIKGKGDELHVLVMREVKAVLVERELSRDQLAEYLTLRLGMPITDATMDAWFRPSRPERFPSLAALLFICEFLSSYEPLNVALRQFRRETVTTEEYRLISIGEQFGLLYQQAGAMRGITRRRRVLSP